MGGLIHNKKNVFFLALTISLLLIPAISIASSNQSIDYSNKIDYSNNKDKILKSEKLSDYTKKAISETDISENLTWIVQYKHDVKAKDIKVSAGKYVINGKNRRLTLISHFKSAEIEEIVDDPAVESVEVDQPMTFATDAIPWNVNLTNAPAAWNLTKGGGVSIAILDSGIASHTDLRIAGGTSVISDNYTDTYGHGTAVAGVLSAIINDEGIVGVAPEADIYAVKITDWPTGMISDALAGLDWAIANNMSIISMSFGFKEYSPAFASTVQEAYANGALFVAAAGNDNGNITYPAKYDEVVAVGAVDSDLVRAQSSNYGPKLELMAPGVDINTTWEDGGYSVLSGTSLSAPHVAGIAALIKSTNGTLSNTEVRNILRNSARDLGDPGKDYYYGYGLVQYPTLMNLTIIEEPSTFYTIFNLTYTNDTQQLTYWKSGNGSYQQENFTIGLFLINITQGAVYWEERINVTDNGTFYLFSPTISMYDNFTVDSSPTTDGKAFTSDTLQSYLSNKGAQTDAYCFELTGDSTFDQCGYKSGQALTDCMAYADTLTGNRRAMYDLCESAPENCSSDPNLDTQWDISTSLRRQGLATMVSYQDCDNSAAQRNNYESDKLFYIFDRRRAECYNSTEYVMRGRYDTNSYEDYTNSIACGSGKTCDYSVDNEVYTTNRSTAINPCRLNQGQTCTATEQCLNGLNCTSNTCTNLTTTNSTDLQIIELIPIQVLPNVPMILGKSGYVLVRVFNNGTVNATGNVSVSFNGSSLTKTLDTTNPKQIPSNQSALFKFIFKPLVSGTNLFINATVLTS